MAINEDTGIEVAVQIDGADLHEYESPDAAGNDQDRSVITKYIESVDDAVFAVRIAAGIPYDGDNGEHSSPGFHVHVTIDGKLAKKKLINRDFPRYLVTGTTTLQPDGQWIKRKFKFTSVLTVDEAHQDRAAHDNTVADNLGKIEVQFWRGHSGRPKQADKFEVETTDLVLSEKSLKGKAISHGTTYGEAKTVPPPRVLLFDKLKNDPDPIPIFRFLYRSKEALKNELVIPRSPPPLPPTPSVKPEKGKSSVKRELYDLTQDSLDENPSKVAKTASGGKVDFIDLTID